MIESAKGEGTRGGLRYGSRANNINLLRFIAASMVLYFHMDILLGKSGYEIMGQGLGSIAVNVFFVLSGYLLAGSWRRSSGLFSYLIRRAARIFPGLIVVVFVTAFVVGPLFTSLGLSEYYSNPATWKYLKNILFSAAGTLPGVFEGAPYPSAVNGSLWTLRYEFAMYLLVPMVYGLLDRLGNARRIVALVSLSFLVGGYCLISGFGVPVPELCAQSVRLASYFFAGCVVYEFELIEYFDVQYSVVAVLFLLVFAREDGPMCPLLIFVATTMLTLGFAFAPQPKFASCFSKNDFSYGIYIWAFPIQQVLVQLGGGAFQDSTFLYSLVAFVVTLALSVCSWFLVEKPCIQWGRRLSDRV